MGLVTCCDHRAPAPEVRRCDGGERVSAERVKEREELRRLAKRMLDLLAREEENDTQPLAAAETTPTDEDFIELRRARRRRGRSG